MVHITKYVLRYDQSFGIVLKKSNSALNPVTYSYFDFNVTDPMGTNHLSKEYSAWVGTDVNVVKVKVTNVRYENITGDIGSGSNGNFGPFRR